MVRNGLDDTTAYPIIGCFHGSPDVASIITQEEGPSPQSHGIGKRALALLAIRG